MRLNSQLECLEWSAEVLEVLVLIPADCAGLRSDAEIMKYLKS